MGERLSAEDRMVITRQVIDSVDVSDDAERSYLGHTLTNFYAVLEAILDGLVAAAVAEERERIATAIEAEIEPSRPNDIAAERGRRIGMEDAARIARSKP